MKEHHIFQNEIFTCNKPLCCDELRVRADGDVQDPLQKYALYSFGLMIQLSQPISANETRSLSRQHSLEFEVQSEDLLALLCFPTSLLRCE